MEVLGEVKMRYLFIGMYGKFFPVVTTYQAAVLHCPVISEDMDIPREPNVEPR